MEVVVSRPTEARIQSRTVCAVALLVSLVVGPPAERSRSLGDSTVPQLVASRILRVRAR